MPKQKVIIVDKDNTPIGLKFRNEINSTEDIYRVSAIWITNTKGEILIAQRKLTKDKDPGMWGPAVAGTIEEGETYESNAYKELEEELGVTGVSLELGPMIFSESPRKYFGQLFLCTLDREPKDFKLQEEEVEQVRWISRSELESDLRANPEKYVSTLSKLLDVSK